MSSESYVEDNIIILPVLKDGVTRLGDLWNCHESKYVGENLFIKYLDGKYINVSPIQNDEYKLIHCKSTSDKIKTFDIGGEMSVEILAGLVTIKGSAKYNSYEKEIKNREQIICHSLKETFSINALPIAKKITEKFVVDKIINKSLKATHFVRRLTLGAEVKADIIVTQNDKSSKTNVKGHFMGKIVYGPINAKVKANLGFLDNEKDTNFEKVINVHSIPSIGSNPSSVEEMFKLIENINTTVNEEKHFPLSSDKVIGVPIRFVMEPISHFIDFDVEKLYLKLSDNVMSDFNEMLVRVQDIQVPGNIFKKVSEMNQYLALILSDKESKLHREIENYEKFLREIGIRYFEQSVKVLKKYKIKEAEVKDLLDIIKKLELECSSSKVSEKIVEFKEEGEDELGFISLKDIEDSKSYFNILTNENSLKQFIDGEKETKICLYTNGKAPDGVFSRLNEMIEALCKMDIRVGIAIKSISSNFQLCVKVKEEVNIFNDVEEIPFILSIFGATVGKGFENELLFHSMNAKTFNITLPYQNKMDFLDIIYLIKKCNILKDVKITRSSLETLNLLTRIDDKWKFFMPIDAIITSPKAFKHFYRLTSWFKDVDCVVGTLNNTKSLMSGFLFLIKNSKVKAVCLDDFDMMHFEENFPNISENDIPLLSPNNINNSFYSMRAQASEVVIKSIELHKHENLNIHEYGLRSFEETRNQELMNSLELACCLERNDGMNFISTIAKFALEESNELSKILSRVGYSSTDHKFHDQKLFEKSKQSLKKSVGVLLANQNPVKIDIAIQLMNTVIEAKDEDISKYEEKVSHVIDDITKDQNCTDELKSNIAAYDNTDLKLRCIGIKSVIENYENKQENDDRLFHTKMLHLVIINDSLYYLNDIMKKYINRISLNENIFGSVKCEFLKSLEQKHYNQLIIQLSDCSFGVKYFILHKALENYYGSNNRETAIVTLLDKMSESKLFNDTHWKDIWKNNRFQYIIRSLSDNSGIMHKLFNMGCQEKVPDFIPQDIAKKIDKLRKQDTNFELPQKFRNCVESSNIKQDMQTRNRFPIKTPLASGPVEIASLKKNKLYVDKAAFNTIMDKVGDHPMSVISINGPMRSGKSYILGHFIRYLVSSGDEEEDWFSTKLHKEFKWKNATDRQTTGIVMWSEPFFINRNDRIIAVLLMDTQGCFDDKTTNQENVLIFALSCLLSSTLIYNVTKQLSEDILQFLHMFVCYATMTEESEQSEPLSQLILLIRDWQNPSEYEYGYHDDIESSGSKNFKKEKLDINPGMIKEVKVVHKEITTSFRNVGCCLMPYPGNKLATRDITDSLELEFIETIKSFIPRTFKSSNICLKKIGDYEINGDTFKKLVSVWADSFAKHEIVEFTNLAEATATTQNQIAQSIALKFYTDEMRDLINKEALSDEKLSELNKEKMNESFRIFKGMKRIKNPDIEGKYFKKLEESIKEAFVNFAEMNSTIRKYHESSEKSEAKLKKIKEKIKKSTRDLERRQAMSNTLISKQKGNYTSYSLND